MAKWGGSLEEMVMNLEFFKEKNIEGGLIIVVFMLF